MKFLRVKNKGKLFVAARILGEVRQFHPGKPVELPFEASSDKTLQKLRREGSFSVTEFERADPVVSSEVPSVADEKPKAKKKEVEKEV